MARFGILAVRGAGDVPRIFAFAAGAVVAFALLEAVASGGFRHRLGDEPGDVRAPDVSFSSPSVDRVLVAGSLTGGLFA